MAIQIKKKGNGNPVKKTFDEKQLLYNNILLAFNVNFFFIMLLFLFNFMKQILALL